MGFTALGKSWTTDEFKAYLESKKAPAWIKGVTLHHSAPPTLAMRPSGFSATHMKNLRDFYRDDKGWSTGPHLFADDRLLHGLTDLAEPGTHARSFNSKTAGIETLGDYDTGMDDPLTGRGLACWKISAAATVAILAWCKLPISEKTILFHRQDPKTTKTCPGERVKMNWFLDLCRGSAKPALIEVPPKPDGLAGFTNAQLKAGTYWCVPVADFLVSVFGMKYPDIASNIKRVDGNTILFGTRLEHPFYEAGATWAGVQEVIAIAKRVKNL